MNSKLLIARIVPAVHACMVAITVAGQGMNYSVKKYAVREGLPDLYVQSIFQDSRGFLWVGTVNGVSRFDGNKFVNYGSRQGLNSSNFTILTEDRQGRFWAGGRNKIFRLVQHRFIEYPFDSASSFTYLHQLVQLRNNELWLLTNEGSWLFDNDHWQKRIILPRYENMLCLQVLETPEGTYYNFRTVIVFRDLNGHTREIWQHAAVSRGMYFNQMRYSDGTLYTATFDGIYRVNGPGAVQKLFSGDMKEPRWRSFLIDSKKRFWVNEIARSAVFVSAPGKQEEFTDTINLAIPLVSFCYEDQEQNIWIASGEGLVKVQRLFASQFNRAGNPLLRDLRNILQTPDHRLLAFSREHGILQFSGGDFKKAPFQFYDTDKDALNDFPDSYTAGDSNRLWLSTRESRLYRLKGSVLTNFSQYVPSGMNFQYSVSFNPLKKELFSSQDSLKIIDAAKSRVFYPANTRQPVIRPLIVKCFSNGKMIFNTNSSGTWLIDERGNLLPVSNPALFGNRAGRFLETPDGNFWLFDTGEGLKHFRWNSKGQPENDIQVTTDDGLPNDAVISLCMDREKRLWAATMTGPAVLKIDSLTKQVNVLPLADYMDILPEVPVNPHIICDDNNIVWLADNDRIFRFDAGKLIIRAIAPRISIENIMVNQQPATWEKYTHSFSGYWHLPVGPVLPHNDNTIQINFTGISLASSAGLLYSYRLTGLDTGWSNPSPGNYVLFTKLAAGHYSFSVKCRTKNSDWSKPADFTFTIQPPFWETWWFRVCLILLAAGTMILFYRNRVKKIKKEARLNNQLLELEMTALKAQMNPHFIYNALNSIQALVMDEKKDAAVYYIGTFSRLLRQVLENAERNVITLEKELDSLDMYIRLDTLRLNIQPSVETHLSEEVQKSDEKIPPLILQPFVENALWHGLSKKEGDKKLSIHISIQENWLVCIILDNGIGREEAALLKLQNTIQYQSKAIAITTRRLTDFNNDNNRDPVIIEDLFNTPSVPAGTKVTLYIKRKG